METFGEFVQNKVRYLSNHDVDMRLSNTIIRHEGKAVYVQGLSEEIPLGIKLKYLNPKYSLKKGSFHIDANSEDLDISSPPVGYANHEGKSVAVLRTPARRQKQGLDINYTDIVTPSFIHVQKWGSPWLPAIGQAIEDDYPDFKDSFREEGLAFCKEFAIHYNAELDRYLLGYLGRPCGIFRKKNGPVVLKSDMYRPEIIKTLTEYGVEL